MTFSSDRVASLVAPPGFEGGRRTVTRLAFVCSVSGSGECGRTLACSFSIISA